jgi:hypothetical protein
MGKDLGNADFQTINQNMWLAAWNICKLNWRTVALVTALAMFLIAFKEWTGKNSFGGGIPDAILWSMMAITTFRTILFGSVGLGDTDYRKTMLPFVVRAWVLAAITYLPVVPIVVPLAIYGSSDLARGLAIPLGVLGSAAFGLAVFGLFGTWLAAIIAGGDRSFVAAYRRGKKTFSYSAPRLAIGPCLLTIFVGIAVVIGVNQLPSFDILQPPRSINIGTTLFFVVISLANVFVTVLGTIILARAYSMIENESAQKS